MQLIFTLQSNHGHYMNKDPHILSSSLNTVKFPFHSESLFPKIQIDYSKNTPYRLRSLIQNFPSSLSRYFFSDADYQQEHRRYLISLSKLSALPAVLHFN